MPYASRLVALLERAAASLPPSVSTAQTSGLWSVALVGSLARGDFRLGGSDLDLLIIHQFGNMPIKEISARPDIRAVVRQFNEPLRQAVGDDGAQKPCRLDCHLVDLEVLRAQPRWAAPEHFQASHAIHDRLLWIYAFDLVQYLHPLWGNNPIDSIQPHDPQVYLAIATRGLAKRIEELSDIEAGENPVVELIDRWKAVAGELMTLLALSQGCRSLLKKDLHRAFNTQVGYFVGKDFAASLWAEYLYGTVFQERADWINRCRRFCNHGLELLL